MSDDIDLRERNLHLQAALDEARAEIVKLRERCDCVGRHKLEQEIERLRAELAALRATAPYRVEQQHQATVEQGEWVVVKLECPE